MMRWVPALLLAALVAAPAALMAHPGHSHRIMGTIEVLHENHVDVKGTDGKTTSLELTEKSKITRGNETLTAADLKVGDRVVVVFEGDKEPYKITQMQVGTATR